MKQIKILFQGDSITDAGRDKRNYFDLGSGYPKYAAEQIKADFPDTEFVFTNFGISGNRTCQLFDRLYKDGIELQPDVISILIGINDVWHRYGSSLITTTDAQIALNYRSILERLRAETNAKILSIGGSHVDVALGNDGALCHVGLACGANQLKAGGACYVAALANGNDLETKGTSVGVGKLNLVGGTEGAENGNGQLTLGANDLYALFASVLTGLGKVLFVVKLGISTEQLGKRLGGHVDVARRGLNDKFLVHF